MVFCVILKLVLQPFTEMESLLAEHNLEGLQYSHHSFAMMLLKERKAA